MTYSFLKSILIAVKCINILKNNTESLIRLHSSCFHKRNSQNGAYLHRRWPTQNSEKFESCRRPWINVH